MMEVRVMKVSIFFLASLITISLFAESSSPEVLDFGGSPIIAERINEFGVLERGMGMPIREVLKAFDFPNRPNISMEVRGRKIYLDSQMETSIRLKLKKGVPLTLQELEVADFMTRRLLELQQLRESLLDSNNIGSYDKRYNKMTISRLFSYNIDVDSEIVNFYYPEGVSEIKSTNFLQQKRPSVGKRKSNLNQNQDR